MKKDTILSVALLAGIGFVAYKFYKDLKQPKLGSPCKFDSGPEGVVVFSFEQVGEKPADRKSTRLNSSHVSESRMPSSA